MRVLLSDARDEQVGVLELRNLLTDWPLDCDVTPLNLLTGEQVDQIRFSLWGAGRVTRGQIGAFRWEVNARPI